MRGPFKLQKEKLSDYNNKDVKKEGQEGWEVDSVR